MAKQSSVKKSVRYAPHEEDGKSLIIDPAPMPYTDTYPLDDRTFYAVDIQEQRHGLPTPMERIDSDEAPDERQEKTWSGSTLLGEFDQSHLKEPEEGDTTEAHRVRDDDDEEFDWNDDPDQPPKPRRRKTARERIQEAWRRPCCWHYLSPFMKRFIIAFIGSCVFISVAVCVNLLLPRPTAAEVQDPNFANVRGNVQIWMYWAAFMWHIGWITTVMIEIVPSIVSLWTKVFRGRRSEKVKSSMEYYMSLKLYIGLVFMASWNWGSWAVLLQYPFQSVNAQAYSQVIWKVFACIFAAMCILFVQKTIIQMIATRFHRFAYDDRVQESKNALKILDSLSKAEGRRSKGDGTARLRNRRSNVTGVKLEDADQEEWARSSAVRPGYKRHTTSDNTGLSQFQKSLKALVLAEDPRARAKLDKVKVDINSDEFAKKVAKKLFYSLAYPHGGLHAGEEEGKRMLTVHDFQPYFSSQEEATKAFTVFDKDGNGDVTRREFRDTVVTFYRERKALSQSMRDTSQALGKIDFMLLLLSLLTVLFVTLAVFNVGVWSSLVPLGSLLLALTFVFGNTAKNTFESILFLFVTHPYDAGDYVLIDDQYLLVHNLGLMGTVFIQGDGQTVYAPTTVLMTKLIANVRRSGSMGESIKLTIDFRTPTEQLHLLRDRISDWVASQTRDFDPGFDLRVTDIIDLNQLIITMWLPHKGNWQELGKRFQRKTRFMLALKDILTELDIRYELPAQRYTSPSFDSPSNRVPFRHEDTLTKVVPQSFSHSTRSSRTNSRSNSMAGAASLDG